MNKNEKDKNKIIVGVLSAFLGGIVFIIIYGIRVLDITYDDWLLCSGGDLGQHYLGWLSYRKSSWHFPIGLIDGIVYPSHISIIYTDSIPLFAVLFKIMSPILPETVQYLGIYGLLCYILQGMFAGFLIYNKTKNVVYSIVSSLFFSLSYIMIQRMFVHTALASHFIILASLYYWLAYQKDSQIRKSIFTWSIISVLSLLIEAYFVPMVFGIMFCALLSDYFCNKKIHRFILPILTSIISVLLVGWCMGLFYGGINSNDVGLGRFSFNLNGFINSQGLSFFLPSLHYNEGQYEGYAYLGIGILVLLVFAIIMAIKKIKDYRVTNSIPYIIFFLGFLVFSLSPSVTLGSMLFEMKLPQAVISVWSTFRSCGRMIWPVYYLIFYWVITEFEQISIKSKTYIKYVIAIVCIVLQIIDLHDYIKGRSNVYHADYIYECSLDNKAWAEISKKYNHIMIYPNTYYMYYTFYKGEELWYYAINNDMTMNIVYLSRNITDKINEDVYNHFSAFEKNDDNDTVYLFIHELPEDKYGLHYYIVNDLLVGTTDLLQSIDEIPYEEAFNFLASD